MTTEEQAEFNKANLTVLDKHEKQIAQLSEHIARLTNELSICKQELGVCCEPIGNGFFKYWIEKKK